MHQLDFTIHTMQDLIGAVERFGFLPYFINSIPGFSIEEHADPPLWTSEGPGPWEWKGPVIRQSGCAYGKFFENKAAYISREWFPDFANYRRDGYDFDARFEDELASYQEKYLYDLIDANGPILSKELKKRGDYGKNGRKGFDTQIVRLQRETYVVISDFVYMKDKHGETYGWGVAEYATPEQLWGDDFRRTVYTRKPEESYRRIYRHLQQILPDVPDQNIRSFLH